MKQLTDFDRNFLKSSWNNSYQILDPNAIGFEISNDVIWILGKNINIICL